MKMKKFVALALAAVMAVSVLAGCGGSGSGVSGSVSTSQVNSLLSKVGSDIKVTTDSSLNNAVRAAASEVASTGSTASVYSSVSKSMGWSVANNISSAIGSFIASGGMLGFDMSYGSTYIIEESRLESNTSAGGIWGSLGTNRDKINSLGAINDPEKFAAAMILVTDGMINRLSVVTNNLIRFTYNVSASKAKTQDGVVYWVFATQVNVHAL